MASDVPLLTIKEFLENFSWEMMLRGTLAAGRFVGRVEGTPITGRKGINKSNSGKTASKFGKLTENNEAQLWLMNQQRQNKLFQWTMTAG